MDKGGVYITLSEGVYRIAAATREWPEFAKAKSAIMQAALDGKLTIYGVPKFMHQPEAIPNILTRPQEIRASYQEPPASVIRPIFAKA